jgi:hypothetical protein
MEAFIVAFRQPVARIARRKTMRVLSHRAQLARTEKEHLIALIQFQETKIAELRAIITSVENEQTYLEGQLDEWQYIGNATSPKDVYNFFEEIGIDPCRLPNRLSDVMEIRDTVARLP